MQFASYSIMMFTDNAVKPFEEIFQFVAYTIQL